ncbi:MAG: hypothetical protein LBC85_07285, partial [Fibromonadaceae bacterium]|nr:hypothetical protein [Fibromonadaceae bacterium]
KELDKERYYREYLDDTFGELYLKIEEKDIKLATQATELAAQTTELAEKDSELAAKDAELAELKKRLRNAIPMTTQSATPHSQTLG